MRGLAGGSLLLVVLSSLACFGGADASAEIETLRRQMAEKDAALHALEATIATCDCPVAAVVAPVAPVAPRVVAAVPAPVADTGPGEVEIKSPPSFKMILDGRPMTYNMVKGAYVERDVGAGAHVVEVQVGASDIVHSESISVESGRRTRYQWKELATLGIGRKGGDPLEQLATVDVD